MSATGETIQTPERKYTSTCEEHGYAIGDDMVCPICKAQRMLHETAEHDRTLQARERAVEAQRIAQAKIERQIESSGLPARFRDYRLDTFPRQAVALKSPEQKAELDITITACRTFVNRWPQMRKDGTNLIMIGSTGTGKTGLACSIVNAVMQEHHATGMFISAYGAVRHQRDTWGRKGKREIDALRELVEPDILVLDEVGVSLGGDAEMLMLWEVINGRHQESKPTILISNIPMDWNTGLFAKQTPHRHLYVR